jgi:hypothetical protein
MVDSPLCPDLSWMDYHHALVLIAAIKSKEMNFMTPTLLRRRVFMLRKYTDTKLSTRTYETKIQNLHQRHILKYDDRNSIYIDAPKEMIHFVKSWAILTLPQKAFEELEREI